MQGHRNSWLQQSLAGSCAIYWDCVDASVRSSEWFPEAFMRSVHSAPLTVRGNEFGQGSKLLFDELSGLRVGDLAALLIDTLHTISDEDLGFVQRERVQKHH